MATATEARDIQKHVLGNGLVVITETMTHVRSVSVGVWVRNGSRREIPEENGLAHFIEHMVFKGTERRSAEAIAREMDSVGGMLDAFTSKEQICFNAKVLDEHLPIAFDVIADLVLRPKFDSDDVRKERQVVLEEIKMDLDNPEYLLHDIFTRGFWPEHPLGRPILGTPETVRRFNREHLNERFRDWFAPDHLVITAAGNVTHEKVLDLVHELFTQNFWAPHALAKPILGTPETVSSFTRDTLQKWFRQWYAPNHLVITAAGHLTHAQMVDLVAERFSKLAPSGNGAADSVPLAAPHVTLRSKSELEQVHICIGVPALPLTDRRRFAVSLMNNILGGGMSSRLFQNIRERQGLAYAIFSDVSSYRDAGVLSVYAGTSLETVDQLIRSVLDEFRRIKDEPISAEELRRAKDHLKGATLLALEGSGSRMNSLARYHIYFDRHFTPQELIAMLESVTVDEVQQIAREFFAPGRIAASVVGNLDGFELTRADLTF